MQLTWVILSCCALTLNTTVCFIAAFLPLGLMKRVSEILNISVNWGLKF